VLLRAERAFAATHDSFATLALARAQVLYGDPSQADATLDRLLAARPQDVDLLYLKGMRHLMVGTHGDLAQWPLAQRWLVKAHKADGDNYAVLYAWVASLANDPQFLSDGALNALLRAAYLAPQATQIQISAALMMMRRGQFDDAIALLSPITVTPRDPSSGQIPALLEQAHAHAIPDIDSLVASFRHTANWRDLNCC
jgi:predicted Zn-dependent protease